LIPGARCSAAPLRWQAGSHAPPPATGCPPSPAGHRHQRTALVPLPAPLTKYRLVTV
jgi:hypothetical protein